MLKVREQEGKSLYDYQVSRKDRVVLGELKEGEKVSILSDSMFKTMFQNENRIKYSAKLLSYFLDISYEELLENIYLSKNELDKEKKKEKNERCDYVAFINGSSVNIEVNNNNEEETLERNIEYAHRLYARKIEEGKRNAYTQVIQFNINNFSFEGKEEWLDIYYLQNEKKERLSDKLIFIQIYIPNLRRKWYNKGIKSLSEREKYILGLIEKDIKESLELGKGIKIMEEYVKEAEEVTLTDDLRESYDKEEALMRQYHREGKEEGIKEGREEGEILGTNKRNKEIALSMIQKGLDSHLISEITGLSKEEIESLK